MTAAGPAPTVRRVTSGEWRLVRALRLEALQDPAAPVAFLESYDDAAARPDRFWQDRAANAAAGATAAQFVAVDGDGAWVGTVTGRVEEPGTADLLGVPVTVRQVHVVGVFVRPEYRGSGLLGRLLDAVGEWTRAQGVTRLRLHVHEDNPRAQAAYLKAGFAPSGHRVDGAIGVELEMVRSV